MPEDNDDQALWKAVTETVKPLNSKIPAKKAEHVSLRKKLTIGELTDKEGSCGLTLGDQVSSHLFCSSINPSSQVYHAPLPDCIE